MISSESPSRIASLEPISSPNSSARAAATASISTGVSAGISSEPGTLEWHLCGRGQLRQSHFCFQSWRLLCRNLFWWTLHLVASILPLVSVLLQVRVGARQEIHPNFSLACGTSWSEVQQGWWLRTWFRWCQIPQIIIANSSGLPWLLRIHDSSSLSLWHLEFAVNSIPIETILSWVRSKTTAHVKEFRLHSSIGHTASLLLCVAASGLILWEWLHDRHATGSFWPCSELANPRCFSTDWSLHSVLPQA